jgi:hypothetical protein
MQTQTRETVKGRSVASPANAKRGKPKSNGHERAEVLDSLGIVPKWDSVKELKQLHFDKLVERRTLLKSEIEFREAKVKDLDEEILAALAVGGVEKVEWEDRNVQIVTKRGASRVVPEKLLEHGVAADTIADCTVQGNEYSYLMIGKPKKD